MSETETVYLVEPPAAIATRLVRLLRRYAIPVIVIDHATDFCSSKQVLHPPARCLLLNDECDGGGGFRLARSLCKRPLDAPIIILGGHVDSTTRQKGLAAGACLVIDKSLVAAYLQRRMCYNTRATNSQSELDGVVYRRLRPRDAKLEQDFVAALSPLSKQRRFFSNFRTLPQTLLHEFTHTRFPRSIALIATVNEGGIERQIGVARYAPTAKVGTAEFAVVVADAYQRRGIATQLLSGIILAAAIAGVAHLEGLVLKENIRMRKLAQKFGFIVTDAVDDRALLTVTLHLKPNR